MNFSLNQGATDRITYLDGLRGVAILLVILFHAFSRHPDIVPYGNQFGNYFWCKYGYLGVQLFFMISGFVIFMTLKKSKSTVDFLKKRWLRLFPAMLVCTFLIYFTSSLFPNRPGGIPTLRDVLPGLTFMEPRVFSLLLGPGQGYLEGSFWSLYIEVQFYIIIGISYFVFGEKRSMYIIPSLYLFYLLSVSVTDIFNQASSIQYFHRIFAVPFRDYGWFGIGIFTYVFMETGRVKYYAYAAILGIISILVSQGFGEAMAKAIIFFCFIVPLTSSGARKVLCNRPILIVGYISYPLYLLHENMMISMIISLGAACHQMPLVMLPIIPIAIIMGISFVITRVCENKIRAILLKMSILVRPKSQENKLYSGESEKK